jgi:protein SCO1/2
VTAATRFLAVLMAAAALVPLGGCDGLRSPPRTPFNGIDVTGGEMGAALQLTDHNGRARSLADFRGRLVVVFFGFTHCPDVCPTALSDAATAVKSLGPRGEEVQVLFVTVDPHRDTQELLRQYVPAFHPGFLGLRGSDAELERVKKDFKAYASVREGRSPETYTVDHTAQLYVFDRQGKVRLIVPPGMPAPKLASDLKVLLDNS